MFESVHLSPLTLSVGVGPRVPTLSLSLPLISLSLSLSVCLTFSSSSSFIFLLLAWQIDMASSSRQPNRLLIRMESIEEQRAIHLLLSTGDLFVPRLTKFSWPFSLLFGEKISPSTFVSGECYR